MNLLKEAVGQVYDFVNQRVPVNHHAPQAVRGGFLAPEYMFSRAIAGVSYNAGTFHKIQFGFERKGEHRFGERRQMEEPEQLALRG
jgi:hypothetical protein